MPIPLSTEKVARAVVKALVRGTFLANSAQADALFAIPANATEADIDSVVNSLAYGTPGVGGTDFVSDGDVNVWVDADNAPSSLHTDYFRIARNGSAATDLVPSTSALLREIMTIGRSASSTQQTNEVIMHLGPRTSLLGVAGSFGATLRLGVWRDAGPPAVPYGEISGDVDTVHNTDPGLTIAGKPSLELYALDHIGFRGSDVSDLRGGFYSPHTEGTFFVGDYTGGAATNALLIHDRLNGDYELTLASNVANKTIYLNSQSVAAHSVCVAVGGWPTVASRTPTTYSNPALLVCGHDIIGANHVMVVRNYDATTTGKIIKVLDDNSMDSLQSFLTCEQSNGGGGYFVRFRVRNTGELFANAYTMPAADMAEWMDAPEQFAPGTVLVVRAGQLRPSKQIGESGVVGAVSTKPGVVLNQQEDAQGTRVLVARSGIVPVKCSTVCGPIRGDGEVLVAGPDGCAVLAATQHPAYGTIVGKALAPLVGGVSPPTTGMVDVLVGA